MTWTSNCNFMYIFCHENYLCTIFCRKYNQRTLFCCKNDSSTLVLLQKQFTHTFLSQKLFTHFFLSQKRIYAPFFCRENDLRAFLSRKRFTHFVRKVFARWKLPSGKFRLFGPLKAARGDKMEKEYLNFPPAPSFPLAPDYSPPLECPLPPPLHQDTQDTDVPIDQCTEDIYCWGSW